MTTKARPIPELSADQENCFWNKVQIPADIITGCWLWTGAVGKNGYGNFGVLGHGTLKPHRISFFLLNGQLDPDLQLDHACFVRNCVNPAHLSQVTNAENSRRSSAAKLSADTVREIRSIYLSGNHSWDELSARFEISRGQIGAVVRNKGWVGIGEASVHARWSPETRTETDRTGVQYGRLTVVSRSEDYVASNRDRRGRRRREPRYVCTCECGGTKTVRQSDLASGRTRSCGCLRPSRSSGVGSNP